MKSISWHEFTMAFFCSSERTKLKALDRLQQNEIPFDLEEFRHYLCSGSGGCNQLIVDQGDASIIVSMLHDETMVYCETEQVSNGHILKSFNYGRPSRVRTEAEDSPEQLMKFAIMAINSFESEGE